MCHLTKRRGSGVPWLVVSVSNRVELGRLEIRGSKMYRLGLRIITLLGSRFEYRLVSPKFLVVVIIVLLVWKKIKIGHEVTRSLGSAILRGLVMQSLGHQLVSK